MIQKEIFRKCESFLSFSHPHPIPFLAPKYGKGMHRLSAIYIGSTWMSPFIPSLSLFRNRPHQHHLYFTTGINCEIDSLSQLLSVDHYYWGFFCLLDQTESIVNLILSLPLIYSEFDQLCDWLSFQRSYQRIWFPKKLNQVRVSTMFLEKRFVCKFFKTWFVFSMNLS